VRRALALVIIGTVMAMAACGDDGVGGPEMSTTSTTGEQPAHPGLGEAAASGERLARTGANTTVATTAITHLTSALYGAAIRGAGDGNVMFSPASVAIALAMTRAGAAGETAAQIDRVIQSVDPETLHAAMNALDAALATRSGTFDLPGGEKGEVRLALANALFGQRDYHFGEDFLAVLKREYGAGMKLVDYRHATEAARVTINAWVAGQTADRITDLVPEGVLDDMTRLTLVNAVYMKAAWLYPFAKASTQDGAFTRPDGAAVSVPLMSFTAGTERLGSGQGDGWQAVELPYAGGSLAMTVLVPDVGRLAAVEQALGADLLDQVQSSLGTANVQLRMPRFEVEQQLRLRDALIALGMPDAFDPERADFSGMSIEERLFIADVLHQANMTVDESGTEAAAATAVVMRATSAIVDVVPLTIDRPFLVFVRDLGTGTVLFAGRITDPTA